MIMNRKKKKEMCYSAESLLISFLVGFTVSFILFQKKKKDKYLKHLGCFDAISRIFFMDLLKRLFQNKSTS